MLSLILSSKIGKIAIAVILALMILWGLAEWQQYIGRTEEIARRLAEEMSAYHQTIEDASNAEILSDPNDARRWLCERAANLGRSVENCNAAPY